MEICLKRIDTGTVDQAFWDKLAESSEQFLENEFEGALYTAVVNEVGREWRNKSNEHS